MCLPKCKPIHMHPHAITMCGLACKIGLLHGSQLKVYGVRPSRQSKLLMYSLTLQMTLVDSATRPLSAGHWTSVSHLLEDHVFSFKIV